MPHERKRILCSCSIFEIHRGSSSITISNRISMLNERHCDAGDSSIDSNGETVPTGERRAKGHASCRVSIDGHFCVFVPSILLRRLGCADRVICFPSMRPHRINRKATLRIQPTLLIRPEEHYTRITEKRMCRLRSNFFLR